MTKSETFYDNIKAYHKKVRDIIVLITEFYRKNNIKTEGRAYSAIRFNGGSIEETNMNLAPEQEIRIQKWLKSKHKIELKDSIYKLDIGNKIYIFKIFIFDNEPEENCVFAGYLLNQSVELRSFITEFRTEKLKEKVNVVLSIL